MKRIVIVVTHKVANVNVYLLINKLYIYKTT